jgi:hypothetical protein
MSQTATRNKYLCGQYLDLCAEPLESKAPAQIAPPVEPAPAVCRPKNRFAACATGPAK